MADINEAVDKYIAAIRSMDIATLMATLTPEALGKAMSLGGGAPPVNIKDIRAEKQSEEGGEYVYHLVVDADSGGGTMMTRWKEIDGAWKIVDLAQV
jgi:uncharacterized membrane protein